MMVIAIVVLGGAYLLYGRYLQNKWGIDPKAKTPAYEMEDGVDYVPADTNVVFGHQFASIAGAGPINGPIQAAIFGWLPVLLWIPMVFMMAVTFTALGCAKRAVFFSIFRKVIIVVPLTIILPMLGLGVEGVFIAEPVSNAIGGLASFTTMYFTLYKKLPE